MRLHSSKTILNVLEGMDGTWQIDGGMLDGEPIPRCNAQTASSVATGTAEHRRIATEPCLGQNPVEQRARVPIVASAQTQDGGREH